MKAPEFWRTDGALPRLLSPLGALYAALGRARRRKACPYRAEIPVICVGNLTAGGAGKTPTVIDILKRLTERGVAAHALTRGYGGSEPGPHLVDIATDSPAQVGDEPLLLAAYAPTWVSRDRVAGAKAAQAAGAEVIIMDDGFQNPHLAKDISLLVIDGAAGLGNGRVIPAGPLREPIAEGLARADAALILGDGPAPWPEGAFDGAVLRASLQPSFSGVPLTGARVFAFAGIGRPEKFFETLRRAGAEVVDRQPFPDHHRYDALMIERLLRRARDQNLISVTTEKDMVKLPRSAHGKVWPVPVALDHEDETAFEALLERIVPRSQ